MRFAWPFFYFKKKKISRNESGIHTVAGRKEFVPNFIFFDNGRKRMPSTAEVANGLIALCKQGKFLEAVDKYYSDKIVSIESASFPGMPAEMQGIEAIRGKNVHFGEQNEIHSAEAIGPFLGDKQFAVEYKLDVTQKASGKRMKMDEMALYTVEGGKIVHEHFFYNTNG